MNLIDWNEGFKSVNFNQIHPAIPMSINLMKSKICQTLIVKLKNQYVSNRMDMTQQRTAKNLKGQQTTARDHCKGPKIIQTLT